MDIERTILYGLVIGGGLAALIKFWFRVDTRFEELQRSCAKLASIMSKMGFQRIPEFLENLAIKDITGAYEEVKDLVKTFSGPGGVEALAAELKEVASRGLVEKLKTMEGRSEVRALLQNAEQANRQTLKDAAEAAGLTVQEKE